ncbi:MAG: hypothetical protein EHM36_01690 [Deltaproteobacteria bacterium]|nr:MAG: hypothetical protein EHM36_01690 [Deltaproteobacteria bacterium]
MDSAHPARKVFVPVLLLAVLCSCVTPARKAGETPEPPSGFLSSRWGATVDEVREAIRKDGNRWFQDSTDKVPCALYASGNYWDFSAIFSYLFTPTTRKLYRVDVTFSDIRAYEKAREHLIRTYKGPAYTQAEVEHWSWGDKSLVILQKDPTTVQVSFSSGPFLILNRKEGSGLR